eukprot:NODE_204_length_14945_cov_0.251313.p12 type:complete len:114 gc:universal NODE_204_length_14945_cov_0.251313:8119-8460(+)
MFPNLKLSSNCLFPKSISSTINNCIPSMNKSSCPLLLTSFLSSKCNKNVCQSIAIIATAFPIASGFPFLKNVDLCRIPINLFINVVMFFSISDICFSTLKSNCKHALILSLFN